MGKKASGKHYVSKGERRSSMSTKENNTIKRALNQARALAKGKRIVVTVANPNKNDTSRPFVRMMYDAKSPKGVIISK